MKRGIIFLALFILLSCQCLAKGEASSSLLIKGWNELAIDNDTSALRYFEAAYVEALSEKDTENAATALLNIGICSYGTSYSQGLHYCMRAMDEFTKLESTRPQAALTGRSKCLQLISTICSRQGNHREAIHYSKDAMKGFPPARDTTGYLGLIFSSLGDAYSHLDMPDSAEYFHRRALEERLATGKMIYLPGSYLSVAEIETQKGNKALSRAYCDRALFIADSTGNRQAMVLSWLCLGNWFLAFDQNEREAENSFLASRQIAAGISDKSFYLKALQHLLALKKRQGNFQDALRYGEEINLLKDTLAGREKIRITKSLEVQFEVAEKDKQLSELRSEKELARLTNFLLGISIGFLMLAAGGSIMFLRKINRRDKLLLKTREELGQVVEAQKRLKEEQMQNELEFKESQLSAMALQMLQKNELLTELKERLEQEAGPARDNQLSRTLSKGLNQDKDWSDFNTYFESLNKNFYTRLKAAFPEISPNDLKICALIKLNLSTKEMAAILSISAESVKTARYRLRKKLQLKSEDNLTDFILNLR